MNWMEFEDFEKLSTKDKIKYVDNNTAGLNTPMWFERLETAWETKSPLTVSPWEYLLEIYWEMMEYGTDS